MHRVRSFAAPRRRRIVQVIATLAVAVAWLMLAPGSYGGGSPAWDVHHARRADGAPGVADRAALARGLVRSAIALVSADPRALGYRLVVAAPRPGLRAQTDTHARTITLFVAHDDVPHRVAHDLAHEIGHAVDHVRLSGADRAAFLRRRGVRADIKWWPRDGGSDYATGAGDFAEVYALCHAASAEFRSHVAARPRAPCALLPARAR